MASVIFVFTIQASNPIIESSALSGVARNRPDALSKAAGLPLGALAFGIDNAVQKLNKEIQDFGNGVPERHETPG